MAAKTIVLGPGNFVRREYKAGAAITPGMLIELSSTVGTVQKHSTGGGACSALFAIENDLEGEEITDAYAADDRVQTGHFGPGEEVYALLANGESATYGEYLESNGDGYLRVVDADASAGDIKPGSNKFIAKETVDLSGSSGLDPATYRLIVEVV